MVDEISGISGGDPESTRWPERTEAEKGAIRGQARVAVGLGAGLAMAAALALIGVPAGSEMGVILAEAGAVGVGMAAGEKVGVAVTDVASVLPKIPDILDAARRDAANKGSETVRNTQEWIKDSADKLKQDVNRSIDEWQQGVNRRISDVLSGAANKFSDNAETLEKKS